MNATTDAEFARRMLELALAAGTQPALGVQVIDDLMLIALTPATATAPDTYTGSGLNRAAAIGWQAKAGLVSNQYDLGGGQGVTLDRSQWFAHCQHMAALYSIGARGVLDGGRPATGIGSIGLVTEASAALTEA